MTPPAQARSHYAHLDGIRGLAIALVVIFHVFVGKVSSGVDVFLFVGGLLLVSSQLQNAANPHGRNPLRSLTRILRRLLPALVTVVGASTIGVLLLYSRVELSSLFADASASVLHVLNWRLIGVEADYDAAGATTTPFQHLWSMSVQLQSYLFVLALVVAASRFGTRIAKVRTRGWQRGVVIVLLILTLASLAYASWLNLSGQQAMNYYSTFSRFWEIGAGGLLGLVIFSARVPAALRTVLAWLGLALILSVGFLFDGAEQFPGPLALVPILGALFLVLAGIGQSGSVIIRCLESPPAIALGQLAYSLYLWHWPLLILGVKATGLEAKDPRLGIPIILTSLGAAWLTHRFIELPLRQLHMPRPLPTPAGSGALRRPGTPPRPAAVRRTPMVAVAAGSVLLVLSPHAVTAAATVQKRADEDRIAEVIAEDRADSYPGAAELLDGVVPRTDVPVYPSLVDRSDMMPPATADDCVTDRPDTEITAVSADGTACEYGDPTSERELYVVGGSHSEQWLGALDRIGRDRGIRVVPFLRAGCPLHYGGPDDPECDTWSEKVLERIMEEPPSEGVFMVSTRPRGGQSAFTDYVPEEYREVFTRIAAADIPVFAIRDNPWLTDERGEQVDPRACIVQHGDEEACAVASATGADSPNPAEAALTEDGIVHLDLTPALTADDAIRPVVGNVLVYRDWNHLTDQYVRTLFPELERQMYPSEG